MTGVGTDPGWTSFIVSHSLGQYKSPPQIFLSGRLCCPWVKEILGYESCFPMCGESFSGVGENEAKLRETWRRGTKAEFRGVPVSGSRYPPLATSPNLNCLFFCASMNYLNIFSINSSSLLKLAPIRFLVERFLTSTHSLTSQSKFGPPIVFLMFFLHNSRIYTCEFICMFI